MKLIAISGGVDSMVLAHKYKDKNVVLAFVNYNVRSDTKVDQKIVEEFAKKNNIKLEKLILDGSIPLNENFENWARNIRYEFFKKIYKKYDCSQLLIAHHKDDQLETCIMQELKNNNKLFFGMKQKTTYLGMKIYRPFLNKYWKNEIYEIAKKNFIGFNDDYTNYEEKYTRNKIRKELSVLSNEKKQKQLDKYNQINENNKKIIKKINNEYRLWRRMNFSIENFKKIKQKEEVIKKYVNLRQQNINLNSNILKNIVIFIESNKKDGDFLLTNNNYISKKNNKIIFKKN